MQQSKIMVCVGEDGTVYDIKSKVSEWRRCTNLNLSYVVNDKCTEKVEC